METRQIKTKLQRRAREETRFKEADADAEYNVEEERELLTWPPRETRGFANSAESLPTADVAVHVGLGEPATQLTWQWPASPC